MTQLRVQSVEEMTKERSTLHLALTYMHEFVLASWSAVKSLWGQMTSFPTKILKRDLTRLQTPLDKAERCTDLFHAVSTVSNFTTTTAWNSRVWSFLKEHFPTALTEKRSHFKEMPYQDFTMDWSQTPRNVRYRTQPIFFVTISTNHFVTSCSWFVKTTLQKRFQTKKIPHLGTTSFPSTTETMKSSQKGVACWLREVTEKWPS